ncbi:hypothetical protein GOBAR_AA17255 [Gossypium barbadense]|uniref:Uncharacterized protein n=1 Tax=Gossypium barbadense TaxID=3634 RepID=A0A2P5XJ94_GOSBA|nr:hypothetical protein GOBAR_AA17255 [Gossypium barbadense]
MITLQARNSGITSNIEDAADPHIVTTTPTEEIPLTVLNIFPFGTVEVSHPKFSTFKVNNTRLKPYFDEIDSRNEEYKLFKPPRPLIEEAFNVIFKRKENRRTNFEEEERSVIFRGSNRKNLSPSPTVSMRPQEELFQILWARPLAAGHCIDWAAIEQVQMADAIRALLTTDPWELFFGIIEPTYLELTIELCSTFHLQPSHDYMEVREHWRRQHPRRLLLMVHVARARHRPCLFHHLCDSEPNREASEGVISIGPYVTRLAQHFGLLNTAAQESSLTLIG